MLKKSFSGNAIIHSNQSFSIIQRRISLSPLPASPVKSGDPLKTIPTRLPLSSILESMCCRNSNAPSEERGVPAENLPLAVCASAFTAASSDFQLTPKGGFVSYNRNVALEIGRQRDWSHVGYYRGPPR